MKEILDGKIVAQEIKEDLYDRATKAGVHPRLAIISVGENPASEIYMKHKIIDCDECGFDTTVYHLDESVETVELIQMISRLNYNDTIHGIIVQLPLPKHVDQYLVTSSISMGKDVDCMNPTNLGKLMLGKNPPLLPCTPAGVIALLDRYGIDVAGKVCTIIGRSNIVGKPLGQMLLQRDATVIHCHSKSPDLWNKTRAANIVISATGVPNLIVPMMLNVGTIGIDIGISRGNDGKVHGDFDPSSWSYCNYITPVPGGVGPMTRAMLMKNLLMACEPKCFEE